MWSTLDGLQTKDLGFVVPPKIQSWVLAVGGNLQLLGPVSGQGYEVGEGQVTKYTRRLRHRKDWTNFNRPSSGDLSIAGSHWTSRALSYVFPLIAEFPQIISFVAISVLPNLKRLLMENDKVINACNNIVYYIVNPTTRGKTRSGFSLLLFSEK